ncbi:MAG TPA: protein kinase, partial [Candidatus Obscuribacterales bacterium]
ELVQFRNQYVITKNLAVAGVIQPYSLEAYRNGYALITEDFGGTSLSHYIDQYFDQQRTSAESSQPDGEVSLNPSDSSCLSISDFLAIALQLADTLGELYHHRIIHKDIKPANILINPETKQVKLIDFSLASLLPRETQEIRSSNILEGTLAYLSPEQTGRMNRTVDYRSDFYSLGVTFF